MHIFTLIIHFNTQDDENKNARLINLIFSHNAFISFLHPPPNEAVGSILLQAQKNAQCILRIFLAKCRLLKSYFLPLISVFTLVNIELRNISNNKMTLNCLIIKCLRCNLSFVIFAITLSLQQFASRLWVKFCVMEVC